MTFQKLEAFGRMWRKNPPPHISLGQLNSMMKSYFGVEDKSPEPGKAAEGILPGFMTQPDFEE
jgi:hypothetical protein